MKKLIILTLMSMTFANTDILFNLILSGGQNHNHSHGTHRVFKHICHSYCNHHHNHYNYHHKYHPNHMFNQLIWLSYYDSQNNKVKKVTKTDGQILEDLQRLYKLYEQGAITQQEYEDMKAIMFEELENN